MNSQKSLQHKEELLICALLDFHIVPPFIPYTDHPYRDGYECTRTGFMHF